jgi:hypothetical protein
MSKLYVFETDKEVREFVINNPISDDLSIGSIERGVWSIIKKSKQPFSIVLFNRKAVEDSKLIDYINKFETFLNDLAKCNLTNSETRFI